MAAALRPWIEEPGIAPLVERTLPLASGWSLEAVEFMISGMSRPVIPTGDDGPVEAGQAAIVRYFADRNAHVRADSRRACRKLSGTETAPGESSASNNGKDPRRRSFGLRPGAGPGAGDHALDRRVEHDRADDQGLRVGSNRVESGGISDWTASHKPGEPGALRADARGRHQESNEPGIDA